MEKVLYRIGEFVDYKNDVHKYVICTIQDKIPTRIGGFTEYNKKMHHEFYEQTLDSYSAKTGAEVKYWADGKGYIDTYNSVAAVLSVGVAICHDGETFNEKKGKQLAYKRARQRSSALFATRTGMINDHLAIAVMDNEEHYIYANPACYMTGYNGAKARYEEKIARLKEASKLTDTEKQIINYYKNDPKYSVEELEKLSHYITSDTSSNTKK